MDFDKTLTCQECIHHEKPSCKRIPYGSGNFRFSKKFSFSKPSFACCPTGRICSEFELFSFYFNSPSYKDFTLESYMVYKGIEILERKILTSNGFTFRAHGIYSFVVSQGYTIYKNDAVLKHYGGLEWQEAFADWVDICRSLDLSDEYSSLAIESFLSGDVSLVIEGCEGWYHMLYKDFFYNNLYRDDGELNVYEHEWFAIPKNHGTYVIRKEKVNNERV